MECHECGCEFSRIASHWRASSCSYPELSNSQTEILTGLLMGDGWAEKSGDTSRVRAALINENYIEYINDMFPKYSKGVSCITKDGFNGETEMYQFSTMQAPVFNQYREWYDDGEKSISGIKLTPTIARHWYACDGSTEFDGAWSRSKIYCDVGVTEKAEVTEMFERSKSPVPSWEQYKRDDGSIKGVLVFNSNKTTEFLDWMGEAPPGFEYKWTKTVK